RFINSTRDLTSSRLPLLAPPPRVIKQSWRTTKRQYQTQLNNPHRKALIEDPALTRWVFARANPYATFRPTFKTSLLGAMFGILPLFGLYYIFKTDRDRKEEQIKAGTMDRRFGLSS
uniref:NADH dehydrogenase [ubiquinone] 1 beta subcomplex subunit 4 n=1 Tax=Gasterosteus aculeatus aculeatus TaxID=481459 RepID=A0AAQ4QN76_GASAC